LVAGFPGLSRHRLAGRLGRIALAHPVPGRLSDRILRGVAQYCADARWRVTNGHGCAYRRRCGCVDPVTGRQYGRACPRSAAGGRHGSLYVRLELPAGLDGRRRRIRRGGYPSRPAAVAVLARLREQRPGDAGVRFLTVGDWLAHWPAAKKRRLTEQRGRRRVGRWSPAGERRTPSAGWGTCGDVFDTRVTTAAPEWPQRGPHKIKKGPGAIKPQVRTGAPPGT
jgi:hypothetical protein